MHYGLCEIGEWEINLGKIVFNRAIVLYNSLMTAREQIVSLHVSDPAVMVWIVKSYEF